MTVLAWIIVAFAVYYAAFYPLQWWLSGRRQEPR